MREGANRSFGLALLASILLHALLLATLPSLRELAAQLPHGTHATGGTPDPAAGEARGKRFRRGGAQASDP